MALIVDQHSHGFKHFCKICKKGFMCGRALGGHMRAHGISDYSSPLDDDDPASDWDDSKPSLVAGGDNAAGGNRRMYALRTNPNRLKSCRACENCGKEFSSWKSFLEHGKCGVSDDLDESLVSSHRCSDEEEEEVEEEYYNEEGEEDGRRGYRWSKRKRSLRVQVDDFNSVCPSSEEEDLANCLMMLSNGTVNNPRVAEPEESCASASRDDDHRRPQISFVAPLAYRFPTMFDKAKGVANSNNKKGGLFECKACKKVFNSHQALGGHRASHKKVKGCFAARINQAYNYAHDDDAHANNEFFPTKSMSTVPFDHSPSSTVPSSSKRKSKVHECSICHRVFSSGQALGGHKRCHWITSNGADVPSLEKLSSFQEQLEQIQHQQLPRFINVDDPMTLKLDLNLPVPPTDVQHFDKVVATEMYLRSWLGLETKDIRERKGCPQENDNDIGIKNKNNEVDVASDHVPPLANNNDSDDNGSINMADDKVDSKAKLAKLSELNDMKIGGSSSTWLQVGIGSTGADEAAASASK